MTDDDQKEQVYDPLEPPIPANGFLFIGDPHLTSRRPTRRTDADFAQTVLRKLTRCMEVANEERLVPVFTGDMFHHAVDGNETLKTRLLRVLALCWTVPFTNVGNHDMHNVRLSDSDTLSVIGASGRNIRIASSTGPSARFAFGDLVVGLGFSPSGQTIPSDVRGAFGQDAVDEIVWVTHHDIAFDGAYPGALEPHEIEGCALLINGHMHLPKPGIQAGKTTWFNIGNITRTAIDALNHEPAAWRFTVEDGLSRVPLPFVRNVFDLSSKFVDEACSDDDGLPNSAFVDLLQSDVETRVGASTSDGGLLLEEIKARFESEKTPMPVRAAILWLFGKATDTAVDKAA